MTDYGATDTNTQALGANQFPTNSVYVPNTGMKTAGGGAVHTDSGGKSYVGALNASADGDHATVGATTDVAVTGDNPGTLSAKARGLSKILTSVWDNINGRLNVAVQNGNPNGQSTMANSSPVAIASNQSGIGTIALPNNVDTWINQAIRNGQGFVVTTGQLSTATNANLTVGGLCIFNPSNSGKNVLIYSLQVQASNGSLFNVKVGTADEAFGNALTPQNLQTGSVATSVATCDSSATGISASVTQHGTLLLMGTQGGFSAVNELLTNGATILLPNGSAHSLNLYPFLTTAGNSWAITAKWIEF